VSRLFTLDEVTALELTAVEAERERIINLLNGLVALRGYQRIGYRFGKKTLEKRDIIALIKGEN